MVIDLQFTPDRIARIKGNRTQEAFALDIGVTQGTVSMWLTGLATPRKTIVIQRLIELEAAL